MYYFDSTRKDDLVPFPGEEALDGWDDHSDADDGSVRSLSCGDLSVELAYRFGMKKWHVVMRSGGVVLEETWPDKDVAVNLEQLRDLDRLIA